MIILEGPDGSGKTTLAKAIAGALDLTIAPRVVSKNAQAMTDLRVWVNENLRHGIKPVIYDRHRLISEPIYGPVLRGHMEPGFDDQRWLSFTQEKFRSLDPMVIFCLPPVNVVVDNVTHDPDNKVVEADIRRIYWLYFQAASLWPLASLYDYTGTIQSSSKHEMIRRVESWMRRHHLYSEAGS